LRGYIIFIKVFGQSGVTWREWRRIRCPKRSSLKNWKGRDEEESPGKDGEKSGKRSSSVGSEKMERVGDRQGQMERYCSTGQSPQRAVASTEEEFGQSDFSFT